MRRWLALAVVLLLWACKPAAPAYDLTGNDGNIHFKPPAGYCPLADSDAHADPWLNQVALPMLPSPLQRSALVPCDTKGQPPSPLKVALVINTYGADSLGHAIRDEDRATLLGAVNGILANKALGSAQSEESLGLGVLYWRSVQTTPNGTWVELNAWTVTRETPVEVSAVALVGPNDPTSLATALTRLHQLLDPALTDFAQANGYDIAKAPNQAQSDAADALGFSGHAASAGAIFMVALLMRPWWAQILASAGLMAAGEMLIESAPGFVHDNPEWVEVAAALFLGLIVLACARGVLGLLSLVRIKGRRLTELMRQALSLQLWGGAADATPQGASFTKRWFVSVAAATGSVVAALTPQPGVAAEFLHAFSLERFVFSVIVMIVTFTLIGPLETYVFESRIGATEPAPLAAEPSHFERLVGLATPRAAGRLLLVLAFALMLTAAHGTVESRLADGDATASLIVVVAGVGPALITYFWCLALQRRAASVARQTAAAGSVLGLTLVGLPISCVCLLQLVAMEQAGGTQGWLILAVGVAFIAASLVLSAVAFGGLSLAGGLVIDFARRRNLSPPLSVAGIGVVMCALVAGYLALWTLVRTAVFHSQFSPTDLINSESAALGAVGWAIGLLISGFPGVLRSSLTGSARS